MSGKADSYLRSPDASASLKYASSGVCNQSCNLRSEDLMDNLEASAALSNGYIALKQHGHVGWIDEKGEHAFKDESELALVQRIHALLTDRAG